MLDIKFVRENPEVVKQNIRNKFQDSKLELVDKVLELDKENREIKQEVEALRAERNKISKQIGALMGQGKREEAEEVKKQVAASGTRIEELSQREKEVEEELLKDMMVIPNIIDPSVPIGKDDSQNVEIEKFGEPVVPDFEVPYHTDIMENFDGIDLDSARRVAGNGFYYLMGDIARLHSAVISYARDFMINRGFTYCVPPFMIRSNVVTGVMSFAEMDAMMYKIEGEDLYLIGTSEHSMIGKFIDQIIPEEELPKTLTSYSPCFRKEKGAHGLEERGVYRIHQFEKQEMIVFCRPEESPIVIATEDAPVRFTSAFLIGFRITKPESQNTGIDTTQPISSMASSGWFLPTIWITISASFSAAPVFSRIVPMSAPRMITIPILVNVPEKPCPITFARPSVTVPSSAV